MTKMRMAAFLVALTMMLSGLAMAQYRDRDDDDDSYYSRQGNFQQARQYGYQNGYRDGYYYGPDGRPYDRDGRAYYHRNTDCDDYYNQYGTYYGSPYCDSYDYQTGYCY